MNIEEILAKYDIAWDEEWLKAIKEIVEKVIDKCAEEADIEYLQAWDGGDLCIVDKDTILNVKNLITY